MFDVCVGLGEVVVVTHDFPWGAVELRMRIKTCHTLSKQNVC